MSGKNNKNITHIVLSISMLLLLMVLTNDLHSLVFKINYAVSNDDYKHNIGYYMVVIWIMYLFLNATIRLVLQRMTYKKDIKLLIPFAPIILGLIYTILYIIFPGHRNITDMSVIISFLMLVGIEG